MPYFLNKFGQNVLAGDLLPDGPGDRSIGSPTRYIDTLYAVNVKAHLIEAARAIIEGVNPNLLRNGSFEQTERGFTNQPLHWVLYGETGLGEAIGAD